MNNIVWDELKFFISRLSSLPCTDILSLSDDNECCCVFTGTYIENWVYYPRRIDSLELANRAAGFFEDYGVSFMWPLYESDDKELMSRSELIYAGDLTGMYLDVGGHVAPPADSSVEIERIDSHDGSLAWSKTARHSFDAPNDIVPASYREYVEAMIDDSELSLYLAKYEGVNAGTFLLSSRDGVYYFGVVPEMRRRGIARAMMNEICRLSRTGRITLQATPMGVPFYRDFGFSELSKMPVYSNESDIL